jgi:hypothetical protein
VQSKSRNQHCTITLFETLQSGAKLGENRNMHFATETKSGEKFRNPSVRKYNIDNQNHTIKEKD